MTRGSNALLQHRALCKFHVTDGQNTRDQIKRVKSHTRDHIAFGIFHSFLVEVQRTAGYIQPGD